MATQVQNGSKHISSHEPQLLLLTKKKPVGGENQMYWTLNASLQQLETKHGSMVSELFVLEIFLLFSCLFSAAHVIWCVLLKCI